MRISDWSSDVCSSDLHRIEQQDIDDLLEAGRNRIDPDGRMVLHAQPTLYTLDGLTCVRKPLGLHADRLGVDMHVVLADGSPLRNLDMCVRFAHLEVNSIVSSLFAPELGRSCWWESVIHSMY